ncbi:MAG: zinc ribbon domain-containing protein [Clostridia bacterium]|mgnify:CR=1 FL=1|nr:zinc ribbon domain-containing protein [Clostridia bacterium]
MFCTKCGAKLEEHQKFCTKCGAERAQIEPIVNNMPESEKEVTPKKKKSKTPLFVILGVLSAVVIIGVFAWLILSKRVGIPFFSQNKVSYENCEKQFPVGLDPKVWGMNKVDFEDYTGLTLEDKEERSDGLFYYFKAQTENGDCKGGLFIDQEFGVSYLYVEYFSKKGETIDADKEKMEDWLSESFKETAENEYPIDEKSYADSNQLAIIDSIGPTADGDREQMILTCYSMKTLNIFEKDGLSAADAYTKLDERMKPEKIKEETPEDTLANEDDAPAKPVSGEDVEASADQTSVDPFQEDKEQPTQRKEWPVWNLDIDREVEYTHSMYQDIMSNLDHYEYHDFGDYYCYVTNGVPVVIVVKEGYNDIGYEREYIGMDIFYVTLSKKLVNSYEFFFADHQLYRCIDYKNNSTHIYADEEWETYEEMSRQLITERAALAEDIKNRLKK